ncbi:hypothetical protein HYU94_01835 [Candidatus Daviesbacteria bacterium]|nr:hypothetical protein [Candidatus Daviesbacteria bacterium]
MTLTQTAILVKQAIIISAVALILGILSFTGYRIWYANYLKNLPPVEEKPDIKFGPLPQIDFPKSNVSSSNFTYSLDTTTGGLPKVGVDPGFEKIIKVYFVTQTFATFLSPEKSQNLAGKFGISSSPEIISETKYRFKDSYKTLTVDLDNGNFTYLNEATISAQANIDEDNKLVSDFKQILLNLGVLKENLRNGRSKVNFSKISEATVARISLWPDSIDKKPIVTADFNKSEVNALVVGRSNALDNYVTLNVNYYPIDTSTFATYALKTPEAAFDDLKNGKGVIVVEPEKPQVSISSISLGYYLPPDYSPYLQPIFIFEGAHFVAYVSAISEITVSGATQSLNTSSQ